MLSIPMSCVFDDIVEEPVLTLGQSIWGAVFAVGAVAYVPAFAEAQDHGQELEVQHWGADIDVDVTLNGYYQCYHPRPVPDQTSYMVLKARVGDTDFSNYQFHCGAIDIQYAVQLTVTELGVVDGQTRPSKVEYHTQVYAIEGDNWLPLLEDLRTITASPGELLLTQGPGSGSVPGVTFNGSRDATTWTFYP